jgi:hypothetical protein
MNEKQTLTPGEVLLLALFVTVPLGISLYMIPRADDHRGAAGGAPGRVGG